MVTTHTGDWRFTAKIAIGKILHDLIMKPVFVIKHIMRNAKTSGNRAGIMDINTSTARTLGLYRNPMIIKLYDHGVAVQTKGACCAGIDIHDARTVAGRLGIPHYVLDYENRFHDQVMQDFADSYLRGETPIPCVRCNQTVKFTDLLKTARDLEASRSRAVFNRSVNFTVWLQRTQGIGVSPRR